MMDFEAIARVFDRESFKHTPQKGCIAASLTRRIGREIRTRSYYFTTLRAQLINVLLHIVLRDWKLVWIFQENNHNKGACEV